MKRWGLGLVFVACGMGVLMAPARVQACSCASEFGVFPEFDAQGLPLNVRVWEVTFALRPQLGQA